MVERRWTCWWWPIGFDVQREVPVPQSKQFDYLNDAKEWGALMVKRGSDWAKVFRTADESDERWRSDA